MRCMVLIKADAHSEAGKMPSEQLLSEMGRFNEALVAAGVMEAGEGLHPSAKGARVLFRGTQRQVVPGPFPDPGHLVAGFWIWRVRSLDEAIEWVKRCPAPMDGDCEIELRPVFEAADFGDAFTPELQAREDRLREQLAKPKVDPVPPPEGATPHLVVRGANDAIAWYERALGAQLLYRLDTPDGGVMHAELQVHGRHFMLGEERPEWQSLSPLSLNGTSTTLMVYVPDVDAAAERAVAEGATLRMPVADMFWGDRAAPMTDPYGHQWYLLTHREDLTPEEIRARGQAMCAAAQG